MTAVLTGNDFGDQLRVWRRRRHHSQLGLASAAGVSQRHISFLETGRSRPSREMVGHLGLVLDLPLRERNALLVAAGFAPVFAERPITDPSMRDVRGVLETLLEAHGPFPAYLVDRQWNIVLANEATTRLMAFMPASAQALAGNVMRLTLHPDGLRTTVVNWPQVAASLLHRLTGELAENPADLALAALADEVRSYPGLPSPREASVLPDAHELLLPMTARVGDAELKLFTTISTFATPHDVTLDELRLETLLPADAATRELLTQLLSADAADGS